MCIGKKRTKEERLNGSRKERSGKDGEDENEKKSNMEFRIEKGSPLFSLTEYYPEDWLLQVQRIWLYYYCPKNLYDPDSENFL